VLPGSCEAFGGSLPSIGTRVLYEVVVDTKTGRPRAESVRPEDNDLQAATRKLQAKDGGSPAPTAAPRPPQPGAAFPAPTCASSKIEGPQMGTLSKIGGSLAYIDQDSGGEIPVLPRHCQAYGGEFPPIGTRLLYEAVVDARTGKLRAEHIQPVSFQRFETEDDVEDHNQMSYQSSGGWNGGAQNPQYARINASPYARPQPSANSSRVTQPTDELLSGIVMTVTDGKYGFITQDSGDEKMFMIPGSCPKNGNVMLPVGTRVQYRVVSDPKTGKPRADDVEDLYASWSA